MSAHMVNRRVITIPWVPELVYRFVYVVPLYLLTGQLSRFSQSDFGLDSLNLLCLNPKYDKSHTPIYLLLLLPPPFLIDSLGLSLLLPLTSLVWSFFLTLRSEKSQSPLSVREVQGKDMGGRGNGDGRVRCVCVSLGWNMSVLFLFHLNIVFTVTKFNPLGHLLL